MFALTISVYQLILFDVPQYSLWNLLNMWDPTQIMSQEIRGKKYKLMEHVAQ
jgi:hypothetical protein